MRDVVDALDTVAGMLSILTKLAAGSGSKRLPVIVRETPSTSVSGVTLTIAGALGLTLAWVTKPSPGIALNVADAS